MTSGRDYIGSIEYTGNNIDLVHTDEGRLIPGEEGEFRYEYYLKDHLGNVRVRFSDLSGDGTAELLQENHYYPFGMEMPGTGVVANGPESKYKYNGKELQDEHGLDWYDYGARMYDPQLGRFHTKDPLMEWHFNYTPYHYCFNNPVNLIDPFGLDTIPANELDMNTYNPEEDVVALDEVTVTGKRPSWLVRTLRKIGRALASADGALEGDGGTQNGGIPLVTSGETYSPTKQTAEHPDQQLNIDDLLPALGRAGAGRFSKSSLDAAKGLKRVTDIAKQNSGNKTSDKDIVNNNTGTAQKTNANGQPIDNNGNVTTEYWINNSNDTVSVASGDGTYNGEIYYPGDTIGATTVKQDGIRTTVVKEKKYPSRK